MSAGFVIGIDLGTTNSVLSFAPLDQEQANVEVIKIPQLVAGNTSESLSSLPSFCYLGTNQEKENEAFELPWSNQQDFAVGSWARTRSAEVPDRTIGAAKSWLCHSQVNRREAILPWNAPEEVEKISPVVASQRYLEHLVATWNQAHPEADFSEQKIVLTVPASFDPVARDLTREAAMAAGFPQDFVLLEEPQAAVYAWLDAQGDDWRKQVKVGESILVCDIGGGTTDLTLIKAVDDGGSLALQRVAVGKHLLVGGDNMDLSLAFHVAELFKQKGTQLDPWQSVSLWHSCRQAKENLLSTDGDATHKISVLGRGSKLIGGTVTVEVERDTATELLLDGFAPLCEFNELPQKQPTSGFQEIGLPYESDPAMTKHIAEFLNQHCQTEEGVRLPDHLLFNGGVFKADGFRQRLLSVFDRWGEAQSSGEPSSSELAGVHDLDNAVSRGACFYGWNKEHGGTRIRGGVPATYYVGIESSGLAIPGAPRPLKALCVVPFGMEEGSQTNIESQEIGLVLGQPVRFRFFSSNTRKTDPSGELLSSWSAEELVETNPLEATLKTQNESENLYVPVQFESRITELGVFELWCVATNSDEKWKLEFSIRED